MQEVRIQIRNEFLYFQQVSLIDSDSTEFFNLLKAKTDNLPLRGYFTRKVFDYLEDTHSVDTPDKDLFDLFTSKIPFILELVITIQYYHNQILDGKGGVYTLDRVKQNLILGNLLKDHLYDYIYKVCSVERGRIVSDYVRKIFQYTDIGQYIEKKHNHYQVYEKNDIVRLPFEKQMNHFINDEAIDFLLNRAKNQLDNLTRLSFLELYFKRIYLVSSSLFRMSVELISALLGLSPDQEEVKALTRFADYYGLMMQLVNDNCDWVPEKHGHKTVAKQSSDAFSDLKNRNVTYPLFLYLETEINDYSIRDFLNGYSEYPHNGRQTEFFNKMVDSGTMRKAIKFGKFVGKEAIKSLDTENSHWEIFEDMTKIAQFNKYYFHILKAEKKIKVNY